MTVSEIITSISSGIAFLLSVFNFCFYLIHDSVKDSIDAFNTLQNESLDKLYFYTKSDIQNIAKHPKSEDYKQITLYLSRIEHYCVGINKRIYSKKIVNLLAGKCLCPLYDKMLPIIEAKRKIPGGENVYCNFEKAVKKLSKNK